MLYASGRVGTTTASQLDQAIHAALDQALNDGHARVVLDLSGVDYVNSAGLAVLERATGRCREAGRRFVVCGLQEPVQVSFDVGGATARLDVAADVAAARGDA